jgi:hypothetical protein
MVGRAWKADERICRHRTDRISEKYGKIQEKSGRNVDLLAFMRMKYEDLYENR